MRLKKDIRGRALCALFGAAVMVLPHGAAGAVENESPDATVVEVATSESEARESLSEPTSEATTAPKTLSEESEAATTEKVSDATVSSEKAVAPEKSAETAAAETSSVAPQSAKVITTGWVTENGRQYFVQADGTKKTGWLQEGSTWYYLNSSGAMQTGWAKVGGAWYYLNSSGAMKTGWAKVSGVWYYLNSSGAMKTGWLQEGSNWYYLKSSGAMATGQLTINGKSESFDSNGVWRNASKGEAVLQTAKSYQGAPYRWGGTTPSGWDCIGFVRYVYAQHGVSIGGYTTSVLSVGRQVSYSQAQAGDILYWPGHVAIYAGNGQNVGAWNESMGTTTGPNSWLGTPTVIRVFG